MVTPKEATTPIATATATATPPGVIDSISQHTRTYGSTEDAAADLHPTPSPRISIPSRSNSRSTSRHGSPTHTTHTGARTSIGKTLEEKHTPYRAIPIHEDLSTLVPSCCHGASYFNMMATSWCMWTIIIPFIILIPISEKVGMSDGQQMILRIVAGCMAGTGLVWIFYHARHVFIGGLCCQPHAPPQNGPLCRTHEGERQYHKIVIQKIYIICNPFGGVGKGMHILENICLPLCRDANVEVTVLKTEYAGHARDYAHTIDLSTHQGLCVIGGDGSFTEVINGLLTRTDKAIIPIGLIPAGSGNSCALDMQIPDAITAMRRILSGDVCYIDANHVTDDGRLNVYSVNELSWGMVGDAAVMAEQIRWVGPSRYDLCAVWLVFRGVDKSLTITLDGQPPRTFSGKFVTAFVNQTQHFGKALRAAPHAKLDDGLMDLVFLREGTRGELLQLFQQLPNGAHTANSRVQFIQAPSIHLQPADPVGVINIDGENCRYDGIIRIVCKHKCLPVFIPPPMNAGAE